MNEHRMKMLAAECVDRIMRDAAPLLVKVGLVEHTVELMLLREAFELCYLEGLTQGARAVNEQVQTDIALLKRQAG